MIIVRKNRTVLIGLNNNKNSLTVITSQCANHQPKDVQHTLEIPNRVLTSQCKSRLPTDFQHTINEMVTYRLSKVILEMNRPKNTQLPRVKEKQYRQSKKAFNNSTNV